MTVPAPAPAPRHHVLSVLVENKAGVLARVASLFARRGYNIFSLAVAPTDDERFSRITVVVDVETAVSGALSSQTAFPTRRLVVVIVGVVILFDTIEIKIPQL